MTEIDFDKIKHLGTISGSSDYKVETSVGNENYKTLYLEEEQYFHKPISFFTGKGTSGIIRFSCITNRWYIFVLKQGADFVGVAQSIRSFGNPHESDHEGAISGLAGYSDVLILNNCSWIKIGDKKRHSL